MILIRKKFDYAPEPSPVETRFWQKVKKLPGDGCWEWQAAFFLHPRTRENTYGCVWTGSKRDGSGRMKAAHIVAWTMENGPVPDGMKVCHRCDNPKCVRHDHLFLGTQRDNVRDMQKKGRERHSTGEGHYHSKLTADQVLEIRRRYVKGRGRYIRGNSLELAQAFGVSRGTITDVVTRAWKHIE